MPVASVRETEAQTSFKLPITGILGLCSEDTFPSLLLTEGKMLFFSSQNPEDTKACRQSSCYSNRDVIPFNVLPQAFTLLVAWLKILCEAFCNSLVTVPSFPWDWWQISASWAFLAAWPCSIHLLIAGKLKSFYPGSGWGTACWGSVSSEDRGVKHLYSVKQLWCSVDLVNLGCSRWDSVTAQLVEALVWKTQTFGASRQIKPSHWLFISLAVVVPKSQSRAQLLGLDCSERLGSAPAEMGVPQLRCLPSVAAAFWGQEFLIPHICDVAPSALLPPCQHSQNLECFLSGG